MQAKTAQRNARSGSERCARTKELACRTETAARNAIALKAFAARLAKLSAWVVPHARVQNAESARQMERVLVSADGAARTAQSSVRAPTSFLATSTESARARPNANATRSIEEQHASLGVQMSTGFRVGGGAPATVEASASATTAIAARTVCRSVRYDFPLLAAWLSFHSFLHSLFGSQHLAWSRRSALCITCLGHFVANLFVHVSFVPGQGGTENVCSGHGKCLNDTTCECSPSWAGEKCDDLCPGGLTNSCSGHGKCVTNTDNRSIAMCICEQGDGNNTLLRWYACEVARITEYTFMYIFARMHVRWIVLNWLVHTHAHKATRTYIHLHVLTLLHQGWFRLQQKNLQHCKAQKQQDPNECYRHFVPCAW